MPLSSEPSDGLHIDISGTGKLLIIGLGNEFKGDDGAGIAVIRQLQNHKLDDRVVVHEAGRNLLNHLAFIEKTRPEKILIIDAADVGLGAGDYLVIEPSRIIEPGRSTHENNLPIVLEYIKRTLPGTTVLFLGIQFDSLEMCEELTLTDKIKEGVDEIVNRILDCLMV